MARNNLFIYFSFLLVVSIAYSQRDKKFFRKDYKYIEATDSFYKFHTITRNWQDAKDMCELEGATFFYPEDQTEADAVMKLWSDTQNVLQYVYIGVSSWIVKGVFETVDGRPISDVYDNWSPGEPNDADGVEDCVIMLKDGSLNDLNCEKKYPFVCKKILSSVEWNTECDMPNLDYVFDNSLGKCYKFHLDQKTWREAYGACHTEQSYLAVVDSQAEADHLAEITSTGLKGTIQGVLRFGAVHLGFHKRRGKWSTTRGTKLENSGYSKWGNQQPDGGDNEDCGAMFFNGLLQDIKCDAQAYFICEHDVASLSNTYDDRYGDD